MQQLGGTNIGATRAHHLYAATNGGYDEVDATETEFRNHARDLNSHIGDSDAQMLINKMENRLKNVANFSFEYAVEDSQLNRLFWEDEMAKYNYKEFGDTISFDATFRTNKYVLFHSILLIFSTNLHLILFSFNLGEKIEFIFTCEKKNKLNVYNNFTCEKKF